MNDSTPNIVTNFAQASSCPGKSFFDFPTWYKYLDSVAGNPCEPKLTGINDIWLVVLAVVEILLRVVVFVAIAYVLIGGFKYITSRAIPEKTAAAKNTIIDALTGLVIAIVAIAAVSFIARSFN